MEVSRYDAIGVELVRKHGTNNPFLLAQRMGIHIYEEDFGRLKGMYRVILRRRCIFINEHLDEVTARIVCAHEIGHDVLHRHMATGSGLHEFALYDMTTRPEYEANMVAAAILLPEQDILEYVYHYRFDAEQIAKAMHTDINLVALKLSGLQAKGHAFTHIDHNSRFLK